MSLLLSKAKNITAKLAWLGRPVVPYSEIKAGEKYNLYSNIIGEDFNTITVKEVYRKGIQVQLERFELTLEGFEETYNTTWYLIKI